ncbi:MAG: hypothetical protein IT260_14520, partial [Saprospiraceae bacterium]|nr:hypothetical protein [Saprospiraceae bacterium]
MKKLSFPITVLVVAFFALSPMCAFAQWVAQNSGTSNHVLGIHFVDPNTGYAAGTAGTILKTTNGGLTWNAQTSGTGDNFYAVCFTDASTGVAVGDNSLLARTTDGGASWSLLPSPVFADWRAVWFLDANTGFVTGGWSGSMANILKTTDGGATWTDISPSASPASDEVVYSIFFTDANTGYACNYNGQILKTLDGGNTWSAESVSNNHLFGLYFTDAQHGYCVGGDQDLNTSVILKTTDAGATWTAINNPDPAANYLIDVEFVDASTGYAAGGHVQNNTGSILKTTDGGLSWTKENTIPASTSRLYRLSLPSATTAYACGLDGTILKTPGPGLPCDNTFVQSLPGMGGSRPNIFPQPGSGDFFATGLRNDSTVIVRFDAGGVPLWARAFRLGGEVAQISDMFVDASGDLIGVAYPQAFSQSELRGMAFRYNTSSHTFVWIQYIPNAASTQIHSLDAENCVLTGISNGGLTHLMKIDKLSGAVSDYNLEGDSGDFYSTLYQGTLYGTCRRYYDGFQASVFAHDPQNGALLWQNTIISNNGPSSTRMYPVKPVVEADGLLVAASGDLEGFNVFLDGPVELVLAKTNLNGDVAWTRQYVIAGLDRPVATAVVPTETGYYLVANLYLASMGDFAYTVLIKTDKQGQLQWAKRLGISGRNSAQNIMERNGYLFLTMASDSYSFNDLLLVKLDENGNTNADCGFVQPIAVEVSELPNIQQARPYSVFDNGVALAPQETTPIETGLQALTYCSTPCPCPDPPTRTETIAFCEGESVSIGGNTYTQAGTVLDTIPGTNGCDTVVTYTLTVLPLLTRSETIAFCPGASVLIDGNTYTQAGTVLDTMSGTAGCDTVVTYTLTVLPLLTRAENIAFCQGESVSIGGNTYTQAGTVLDTIPGTIGCDTVVTYTLTVLPLLTRAESIAFCQGESVLIGGNMYTQAGTVLDTIPGIAG